MVCMDDESDQQVGHSTDCICFHTAKVLTLIDEYIIIKNIIYFACLRSLTFAVHVPSLVFILKYI